MSRNAKILWEVFDLFLLFSLQRVMIRHNERVLQ